MINFNSQTVQFFPLLLSLRSLLLISQKRKLTKCNIKSILINLLCYLPMFCLFWAYFLSSYSPTPIKCVIYTLLIFSLALILFWTILSVFWRKYSSYSLFLCFALQFLSEQLLKSESRSKMILWPLPLKCSISLSFHTALPPLSCAISFVVSGKLIMYLTV